MGKRDVELERCCGNCDKEESESNENVATESSDKTEKPFVSYNCCKKR